MHLVLDNEEPSMGSAMDLHPHPSQEEEDAALELKDLATYVVQKEEEEEVAP